MKTKQTKPSEWEWEKEFDKQFVVEVVDTVNPQKRGPYALVNVSISKLKSFIREVEDQTRQQTLEEVFDLLEAGLKEADGGFFGRRITLKNMIVVLKTIKKSLLNQLKEK